jgi:hypothetical protein
VNNWLRLGFTQDEIDNVATRLLDALFAWGSVEKISERVNAHLAAGADHVCMQVLGTGGTAAAARPAWRELAKALL